MDNPIHTDTINIQLSFLYFEVVACQNFYKMIYDVPLKIFLLDPDEVQS